MRASVLARAAACGLLALGCREAGSPPVGLAALPSAPSAAPPVVPPGPASAGPGGDELAVGRTVPVRARHPSGVPLHPAPESNDVSGRLADGSEVRIESIAASGRWFEVSQGATRGWVTRRYLSSTRAPSAALRSDSVFASREACLAALGRGERAPRPRSTARLASWNLHWFPDGKPGKGGNEEPERGTDLEWLACTIAWLDVDVLAAQELKGTAAARQALDGLRAALDRHSGGRWSARLDACDANGQHVGLFYDEKRVRRLAGGDVAELNPHGKPCQDQLRPGHAAYLRFPGGLDLHVISAHFKAGGERRSLELRQRSFAALSEAHGALQTITADADVLVLGDLNTMGCPDCSPPLSHEQELARVERSLAGEGFRRLASDVACSHHFEGEGSLLDGAVAALGFVEAGQARVTVSGLCAELGCKPPRSRLAARERLSDHCPVYVDLPDVDRD